MGVKEDAPGEEKGPSAAAWPELAQKGEEMRGEKKAASTSLERGLRMRGKKSFFFWNKEEGLSEGKQSGAAASLALAWEQVCKALATVAALG
eukprot:scaffold142058_cov13-Tisochrysis_lutea.AAC.1